MWNRESSIKRLSWKSNQYLDLDILHSASPILSHAFSFYYIDTLVATTTNKCLNTGDICGRYQFNNITSHEAMALPLNLWLLTDLSCRCRPGLQGLSVV